MGRPSCRLRYHGTAILASAVCRNCTLSPKSQVPVTGKKKPAEFVEDQCGKGGQPSSLQLLFFCCCCRHYQPHRDLHSAVCLSVFCVPLCLYLSVSLDLSAFNDRWRDQSKGG